MTPNPRLAALSPLNLHRTRRTTRRRRHLTTAQHTAVDHETRPHRRCPCVQEDCPGQNQLKKTWFNESRNAVPKGMRKRAGRRDLGGTSGLAESSAVVDDTASSQLVLRSRRRPAWLEGSNGSQRLHSAYTWSNNWISTRSGAGEGALRRHGWAVGQVTNRRAGTVTTTQPRHSCGRSSSKSPAGCLVLPHFF